MVHTLRSGLIAAALFCASALAFTAPAQARSNFFFSANIGLPLYADSYWYRPHTPPPYYYRPHVYAPYYYAPRPVYYPRPYYRPYYGAVVPFPGYDVLQPHDRDIYFRAYRGALAAPIGQSMVWNSDRASGAVTTTRDGWAGQRYCREFRQEITIDGRNEQAYGTACQTPDGDWQLVDTP